MATGDQGGARSDRESALDRRARNREHALLRHHEREDGSDSQGETDSIDDGHASAAHRQPQAVQGGRPDASASLAAVQGCAHGEDNRRSEEAERGHSTEGAVTSRPKNAVRYYPNRLGQYLLLGSRNSSEARPKHPT